jgi:DNA-binding LytR/AlgR family response regulator
MLSAMLRALLVDDEAPARRRLLRLLEQLAADPALPRLIVVGQAEDGSEALAQIAKLAPTLLFLDIHMPGLDGLALAQRYHGLPPIVFTTAFDQHAVAAFEVHAVDYLLKPIAAERLAQALFRAAQRVATSAEAGTGQASGASAMGAVLSELAGRGMPSASPRIVVSDRGGLHLFDAAAIARFWSADKYTAFFADGREQLTAESLNELEARLAGAAFLRVHRGELVNLRRVRALHLGDSVCEVELDDGQRARVSRRLLPQVRAALLGRVPGL